MVGDITFGVWLKRRRRQRDLTQKELAFQTGCSVGTIRKIEADLRRPSRQLASLLAQHLDIPEEQVEVFIAFARSEPYLGDTSFPTAVLEQAKTLSVPGIAQEIATRPFTHNLPPPVTPFVGREEELAALAGLIVDPHVRLITITGPGGIGKTRLALQSAGHELGAQSRFPDGVFFVSLAPLESAEEIAATMAVALDFQFQETGRGPQNDREQILNYLHRKEMLLVLDNFEQILDGREFLAEIGAQATGVKLLVTSRERLQMRGEQLFPLGGLETARGTEAIEEAPAAALFLNIARRTVPDFQLLEADAEHLRRICRLVEGMPLGLELAASWVGLLPLAEIAAEIEQSLELLAAEYGDVPQRHQSILGTLDLSWRRLTPDQQRVFQQLTVFRGGFTRTAALDVAGATLPLLVTLANKSWLAYDRQRDRYSIHELLRQYGAAKLAADSASEARARERHSAYFCSYLQEHEGDWFGPRQKDVAAGVREDIDNIQRAWRWAANAADAVLLDQGLNCLCRFYLREGRREDGRQACRSAAERLSTWLAEYHGNDSSQLALLSLILARESEFVSDVAQKLELLTQSQEMLDRAASAGWDVRLEQAFIYLNRAYAAWFQDYEEAIQYTERSLALFRELGSVRGEAEALEELGTGYMYLGSYARANDLLHSALSIEQGQRDTNGVAVTMRKLGLVTRHQGNFEEAEALQRESLALFQELADRRSELIALYNLSYTLSLTGKFLAASETSEQLLEMDRDLGQHPNPAHLNTYSKANIHLGRYDIAKSSASETVEIARRRGLRMDLSWALLWLGMIALKEGDLGAAKRYLEESLAIVRELKHIYQAVIQAVLGYVVRVQGDGSAARDYLKDALRPAVKTGSITPITFCLPLAALLAADEDRAEQALMLYGHARQYGFIANSQWFADVAGKELDALYDSLPTEVAAAAAARVHESDVWQTAAALLRELDGR